jgi:hypothetical protein
MKKKKYYKVYADGGRILTAENAKLFGSISGVAAGVLDGFTPTDHAPSLGLTGAKGALSGAAAGATFGPLGAAVGGGIGLVSGLLSGAKGKRDEINNRGRSLQEQRNADIARSQAAISADPSLVYGNKGVEYFALGGNIQHLNKMNGIKQFGGKLVPVSTNNTVVKGPTHAQGGVQMPQLNAELEGGETTAGSQVFSRELGFADLHKPIAKAIGKIEQKAVTMERINALQRLKDREQALYMAQEQTKQLLNIQ